MKYAEIDLILLKVCPTHTYSSIHDWTVPHRLTLRRTKMSLTRTLTLDLASIGHGPT